MLRGSQGGGLRCWLPAHVGRMSYLDAENGSCFAGSMLPSCLVRLFADARDVSNG